MRAWTSLRAGSETGRGLAGGGVTGQDPELLRRLLRAKDRMDAASHENWPVRRLARISGVSSPMKVFSIGVSPATGFKATTRMPNGASSTAIARVAVMTKPLLALYQARRGRGLTPAVDAMSAGSAIFWK